jgi:hypothetical protein
MEDEEIQIRNQSTWSHDFEKEEELAAHAPKPRTSLFTF